MSVVQSALGLYLSGVMAFIGAEGVGPRGIEIINVDGSRILCPAGKEVGIYMPPEGSVTSTVSTNCNRTMRIGPGMRVLRDGKEWRVTELNPRSVR